MSDSSFETTVVITDEFKFEEDHKDDQQTSLLVDPVTMQPVAMQPQTVTGTQSKEPAQIDFLERNRQLAVENLNRLHTKLDSLDEAKKAEMKPVYDYFMKVKAELVAAEKKLSAQPQMLQQLYAVHGINAAVFLEAISIEDHHASVIRAVTLPVAEFKQIPKDPVEFFVEAQERAYMLRAMIGTEDFRREDGSFTTEHEERWAAFLDSRNDDYAKRTGRDSLECEECKSYFNTRRMVRLPLGLNPFEMVNEDAEHYKPYYDRLDEALINITEFREKLGGHSGSEFASGQFSDVLFSLANGFNEYFYMASALADEKIGKKKLTTEDKDEVMATLTKLSYDYGLLVKQAVRINESFSSMDLEGQRMLVMYMNSFKEDLMSRIPSQKTIYRMKDLSKVAEECEQIMDQVSGIYQYADAQIKGGLTEAQVAMRFRAGEFEHIVDRAEEEQGKDATFFTNWAKEHSKVIESREAQRKRIEMQKKFEEDQKRLAEEAELERQRNTTSVIGELENALEEYIPEKEIRKLKDYKIGDKSYEGIGKCSAYFIRKGHIAGGKLKNAIEKHVDRFLRGKNITSRTVAKTADAVISAGGLFSEEMSEHWKDAGNTAQKLSHIRELMAAEDDRTLAAEIQKLKPVIGAFPADELSADSPYFIKYPHAAKIVYLRKLLSTTEPDAVRKENESKKDKKKSDEFAERLSATKYNIEKLYQTIVTSKDYRDAMGDQQRQGVQMEYSPKVDQMYKDMEDLAEQPMLDVMGFRVQMDGVRSATQQAAFRRKSAARMIKVANDEALDTLMKARRMMFLSDLKDKFTELGGAMQGLTEEREQLRLASLARRAEDEPDPEAHVGERLEEVIRGSIIKQMSEGVRTPESVRAMYGEDIDTMFTLIMEQITIDAPSGASDLKAARNLSCDQIRGYVAFIHGRLSAYERAASEHATYFTEKKFRDKLLRKAIIGELSELPKEKIEELHTIYTYEQKMLEDKDMLLMAGETVQKPRLFFDLMQQRRSSSKSDGHYEVRGMKRIKRMEEVDQAYSDVAKKTGHAAPMNYYEYAVKKNLSGDPTAAESAYEKYLDEWISGVKKEKKSDKAAIKALDEFKKAVTDHVGIRGKKVYIYGGIRQFGQDGIDAFGADLNLPRTEFDDKMRAPMMSAMKRRDLFLTKTMAMSAEERKALEEKMRPLFFSKMDEKAFQDQLNATVEFWNRKNAQTPEGTAIRQAIERKDERLHRLEMLEGGSYRPIIPILMSNEIFSDLLLISEDFAFNDYLDRVLPRTRDVLTELLNHPYTEQYLRDKKDVIERLIFVDKTANIKQTLDLSTYDKQIESHEIADGVSIASIIRKAINSSADKKQKDAHIDEGNLVMAVLLYDGPMALMDEKKMEQYRERASKNEAALNMAIDAALLSHDELTEKQKEVSRKAIIHNERICLFMVPSEEYDPATSVTEWLKEFEAQRKSDEFVLGQYAELKEVMQTMVDQKERGRKAFRDFYSQTMEIRSDRSRSMMKKSDYWQGLKTVFSDEDMQIVMNIVRQKDMLPADGRLNSLYSQMLTRVAAANNRDSGYDLLKIWNTWQNITTFYNTALGYLKEQGFHPVDQQSMLNGLFDFYGEMILNPEINLTPEVLHQAFDTQFNSPFADEFLRYINDDTGGYGGISSDKAISEYNPFLGQMSRESFEGTLAKNKKEYAEYDALSTEAKMLFGHLVEQEGASVLPMSALEQMVREAAAVSAQKSDLILSFINGEEIAPADYGTVDAVLHLDGKFNKDLFARAMKLVHEAEYMRENVSFVMSQDEYDQMMGRK